MLSEPIILVVAQLYNRIYSLSLLRNYLLYKLLRLCPAILLVNKRAHREASPLLYSRNCFKVQTRGILTLFLDNIRPQNVSFLRHIYIAFPAFDDNYVGSVTLKEDSIRTLELIRDNCTNLIIFETSLRLQTINIIEVAIDILDCPQVAAPLALVDARFKTISSLKEIIINIYDEPLNCDLKEKIRGCGQTIESIE